MKLAALLSLALASLACATDPSLELTLPPKWYAVPGVPMSLYYDNIVLTEKPESYRFEITCDIGKSEPRRWTVTATDREVGDHAMKVVVKDDKGAVVQQGQTVLHVARRNAGEGRNLRLLIIGDSLTAATMYPNDIGKLLNGSNNPKWTMIASRKLPTAAPGVTHEGYGGWKWIDFLNKWDPKAPDVAAGPQAKRTRSPFLFADTSDKPQLDIPQYFREFAGNQPPDVITFLLGINDCFGASPDDMKLMRAKLDEVLDNADKLLAEFHKAAPNAVFAVGLTTPPNAREEGFVANYKDKYHRWGWKRIQHRLVQRMLERFSGREKDGIHLVPTELNVDPVDGYPNNNGVHPNAFGYSQIGASFYSWMKAWMESGAK